jgi:hypothetical protein
MADPIGLTCIGVALRQGDVEIVVHGRRHRLAATCEGRPPTPGESVLVSVDLALVNARILGRDKRR